VDGWQNLKDFYNLINVYMDSVLHPAITPWTLKQEGWHYDIEDVYIFFPAKSYFFFPCEVRGPWSKRAGTTTLRMYTYIFSIKSSL
jgi:hypothetical protein